MILYFVLLSVVCFLFALVYYLKYKKLITTTSKQLEFSREMFSELFARYVMETNVKDVEELFVDLVSKTGCNVEIITSKGGDNDVRNIKK